MTISDKVIAIIAEQAVLEPSDVTQTARWKSLGSTAWGWLKVIFAIEEEFDITIPFNANEPSQSDFDISNVAPSSPGSKSLQAQENRPERQ